MRVPVSCGACEAQSLLSPAAKPGPCGWLWAAHCCLAAFPASVQKTWCVGSSFHLYWASPLHLAWSGCPPPAQPRGTSVSAAASSWWISLCLGELWRGQLCSRRESPQPRSLPAHSFISSSPLIMCRDHRRAQHIAVLLFATALVSEASPDVSLALCLLHFSCFLWASCAAARRRQSCVILLGKGCWVAL